MTFHTFTTRITPNTRSLLMAGMRRLVSAEHVICAQITEPFRAMAVRGDGHAHQGMLEVTGGDGGQLGYRGVAAARPARPNVSEW